MNIRALQNLKKLSAFDSEGNELPQQAQNVFNSAAGEYLPKLDACVIQWSGSDLAGEAEKLSKPINGYRGDWAWGSGVKNGRTIGLKDNWFARAGVLNFEEDRYRIGASYFANSPCGVRGRQVRVMYVPEHTMITLKDGSTRKIEDGAGINKKSMLVTAREKEKWGPVSYSSCLFSDTALQYFEMNNELLLEIIPTIDEKLEKLASGDFFSMATEVDESSKTNFILECEADDRRELDEHPYFTSRYEESAALYAFKLATGAGIRLSYALIVPTTSNNVVLPQKYEKDETYNLLAYPVDQKQNIQNVIVEFDTDEAKRISTSWYAQYRATSKCGDSLKGVVEFVDDELMPDGVDAIYCCTDLKLSEFGTLLRDPHGTPQPNWAEAHAQWKKEWEAIEHVVEYEDIVISYNQVYMPGSAIGVPYAIAKKGGRDFDGDGAGLWPASNTPEMTRQIRGFGEGSNPKLPKRKTLIGA